MKKSKRRDISPPRLGQWLLRSFCSYDFLSTALWDLEELFQHNVATKGLMRARWLYLLEAFSIVFHLFSKGKSHHSVNNIAMVKHNLLISLRSFKRFKTTFIINLLGLASGLASALLIYLWVHDELSMNKFDEKDSSRHVQVIHSYPTSGSWHTNTTGTTPNPLFEWLAEDLPEVEYTFPVMTRDRFLGVLSKEDRNVRAKYQFIGEGYYNAFPGDYVQGDKATALNDLRNIVISKPLADQLFQSVEAAMGQVVEFKEQAFGGSYLVTGVFNPQPNASEQFDVLFSYELFRTADLMQWYNGGTQAHLILKEGVDLAELNKKLSNYLTTKIENWKDILYAQPYSEKYLYGKYEEGLPQAGKIIYVRLFGTIALIVLAIACINYMNFSTARASRRIKEIGVKKAIGAGRKSLIIQYFSESMLMAFLSLGIAAVLVVLLLPQFNTLTGKELSLNLEPIVILSIAGITCFTGLISGIYPALHLSGFKPQLALKGQLTRDRQSLWVRKGLVIFQFAISVILIVSVVVIYKQVEYIQTTNLGYNKDHIITFPKEGKLKDDYATFLTEARKLPGVVKASTMSGDLPGRIDFSQGYKWEGMSEGDNKLRFYQIRGGYDLPDLLGVTLKNGRSFSRDFATDKDAIILNEAAVEMMNFENPIGQILGNYNPNADSKEVIGVVENFHYQTMQEKVKPFFFSISPHTRKFVIKLQAGTEKTTIGELEALYSQFNEGYPFEYRFLDENYQAVYAAEERIAMLSRYFAGIAVVISCLGLLALTAFSTQKRFKEIAIRKVLGSSNLGIVRLLSSDFIRLVFLAIIIALPISYYLVSNWLENFAYRISLSPTYFVVAGALMLLIAWLTIVTQTVKSAQVNVSESLKAE